MDDRLLRVESAVREIEQSIGHIERRLAVVERAVAATAAGDADLSATPADVPHPALPALPALASDIKPREGCDEQRRVSARAVRRRRKLRHALG